MRQFSQGFSHHNWGWSNIGGTTTSWFKSFDYPLDEMEQAESLLFRERCGCFGDVRFYDIVAKTIPGQPYECWLCQATWIVGIQ